MTGNRSVSIAVVVPSIGRPLSLARTLDGVKAQSVRPSEVIVVARGDDPETRAAAEENGARVVIVDRPGAVQAVQCGVLAASADVVAVIDDDAVPGPDWVHRIQRAYETDEELGALGGRDNIDADSASGSVSTQVGLLKRGKVVGNHHLGKGEMREAVHLKGANLSVLRRAASSVPLSEMVIGTGAQIRWEFVLSLAISAQGYKVAYDPRIQVDHFPAARPAGDGRAAWAADRSRVLRYNESVAIFRYVRARDQIWYIGRTVLIGDGRAPGVLLAPVLWMLRSDRAAWSRLISGLEGLSAGCRAGLARRSLDRRAMQGLGASK